MTAKGGRDKGKLMLWTRNAVQETLPAASLSRQWLLVTGVNSQFP